MDLESAIKELKQEYRIVSVDGEARIITCDFRIDRLNLYVENNIIVKVENG